jgi:hypothetical protein
MENSLLESKAKNETYESIIFKQSDSYKASIIVITVSLLYLLTETILLRALGKTKTIPSMAKFLSMSLIWCYQLTIILIVVRRITFLVNGEWLILVTVFSAASSMTRYTIIAMLAIDRVMVLQYPLIYGRFAKSSKIKIVSVIICVTVFCVFAVPIILTCNLSDMTVGIGRQYYCILNRSHPYIVPILGPSVLIAIVSFVIIVRSVVKHTRGEYTRHRLSLYKTTFATLANILNCIFGFVFYIIAAMSVNYFYKLLIINEAMVFCSSFIDALIYQVWFKECRLELLKIASIFFPKMEERAERLRYSVFHLTVNES